MPEISARGDLAALPTIEIECLVIGAGVVGLAIARRLAESGLDTILAESEASFGHGTSSRNSEVIHAGIYYPANSIKAEACVAGKRKLYDYCRAKGVEHRKIGKLIVAARAEEEPELAKIIARAEANGVDDLVLLDRRAVAELEPDLTVHAALLSPSTGIIDSHALMSSLLQDFESAGGIFVRSTTFLSADIHAKGIDVLLGGDEPCRVRARHLINSGGLAAQSIANAINGFPPSPIPQLHLAKGNYYSLTTRHNFRHLIYPVPEPGGLGVHATLDLAGACRFGPDVEWLANGPPKFDVDPSRADSFYAAIRRYWPLLPDNSLIPAYAGIRPKLTGPGGGDADFAISGPEDHKINGVVNLFGIESPGLTSCLAIAEIVTRKLGL